MGMDWGSNLREQRGFRDFVPLSSQISRVAFQLPEVSEWVRDLCYNFSRFYSVKYVGPTTLGNWLSPTKELKIASLQTCRFFPHDSKAWRSPLAAGEPPPPPSTPDTDRPRLGSKPCLQGCSRRHPMPPKRGHDLQSHYAWAAGP